MKKIVLRYGIKGAVAELVFFVLTWVIIYITKVDFGVQGYIGYADIICPLLFIYFGIRYYRDNVSNGQLTFLQAVKVGLLIVILPTLSFALIETVYTLYITPNFYETVYKYDMTQYAKTHSATQLADRIKEVKTELTLDKNPLYNFAMMVLIIGATGILITLISSLLLMRKNKKLTS